MHVAGGGQHQLTASVMCGSVASGCSLFSRRATILPSESPRSGAPCGSAPPRHFRSKTGFQQHVIEIVMRVSDFHGLFASQFRVPATAAWASGTEDQTARRR